MGDIGKPVRHTTIEPLPLTEPVREPAPVQPEKVPA